MPYNSDCLLNLVSYFPSTNVEYTEIVNTISNRLSWSINKIINFDWDQNSDRLALPFWGRNALETLFLFLQLKIDPYRVLTVYKIQNDPTYNVGKRAPCAIEWQDDVMGTASPTNLWSIENKKTVYDRAILSKHSCEIFWVPAHNALISAIDQSTVSSTWIDELKMQNVTEFINRNRSTCQTLFSSFSKGVHSETLIFVGNVLDDVTLKSLLADLFRVAANFSLVSCYLTHIPCAQSVDLLLEEYVKIEEIVSNVF